MNKNFYSFIYAFDLIGASPQLLIFKNSRYKTLFSSIISIIIIILSIIFASFSLNDYLKFENPIIVYSKDNDVKTKRNINIKDTLFMFQLVETKFSDIIDNSLAYYEADFSIMYDNGTYINTILELEKCEMGKNVDLKYKSDFDNKYKFGRELSDFYCISFKHKNLSLFYSPNIGYSYINLYIVYKNNTKYIPEKIQSLIISECDLIDNNNKHNPISQNFCHRFTAAYNSHQYTKINFNFQYIKYESDDGLFYKNSKYLKGTTFSDITHFTSISEDYVLNKDDNSQIGIITFSINKSNYDNYKRSYPRFQSLLADVMSVVSLLFEIGKLISSILCDKKMSKDIVRYFFNKNINYILYYENSNNIIHKLKSNEKSSERSISKFEKNQFEEEKNVKNISKINTISTSEEKKNNKIKRIFKNINYCHIFKSLFCFKDKRSQLINMCHEIITEDLCVKRIIDRFNNLEMGYNCLYKEQENEFKFVDNNRIKGIIDFLSNIKVEIKMDPINKEDQFK